MRVCQFRHIPSKRVIIPLERSLPSWLHLNHIANKIWGMKQFFTGLFELLKESGRGWSQDNASLFAAALAYYTIFALAPLLVIAVTVAGVVFGDAAVQGDIVAKIDDVVGSDAAVVIQDLITNARLSGNSVLATILSAVLLLFGASGLFSQLQRTLNMIWGLSPGPKTGFLYTLRKRALTFGMVLVVGLLMMVSFAFSTLITAVGDRLAIWLPGIGSMLPQINFLASLVILTVLFALLFKVLPDAALTWKDVLLGAGVTTVLFMLGRYLIGLYLARGSATSAYGAAGALVLILLFVYYSAQIFLFGAEFTRTYANKYGSRLIPSGHAVWRNGDTPDGFGQREETPYRITMVAPEEEAPLMAAPPGWQRPFATGLLGLAAGLLLGFLGNLQRGGSEKVNSKK